MPCERCRPQPSILNGLCTWTDRYKSPSFLRERKCNPVSCEHSLEKAPLWALCLFLSHDSLLFMLRDADSHFQLLLSFTHFHGVSADEVRGTGHAGEAHTTHSGLCSAWILMEVKSVIGGRDNMIDLASPGRPLTWQITSFVRKPQLRHIWKNMCL